LFINHTARLKRYAAACCAALLGLANGMLAAPAHPAPRIPADDATVLERLPTRRDDAGAAELRRLRAELAAQPTNPQKAAALARQYFDLAAAEGDPRYVGYAEAALRPWRSGEIPAAVLYARALLRQYRHDFDAALHDLEGVLHAEPDHYGARAWRAAIYMVRAEYDAASRECAALPGDPAALYATGCRAYVEATTGRTGQAYEALADALRRDATASDAEKRWRMGDDASAERAFKRALTMGEDNFVLAAYADFLLEHGRHREVIRLLDRWVRSDTLLLRLALAERASGAGDAEAHIAALRDRFAAAALRGERLHLAEEARYLLDLKGDARGALALALQNWQDQREPRDALIVLQAALAAGDAAAAAPVKKWLETSRFESEKMRRIAASLK
jgi:Tfp pilus assembly protein PilF